MSGVVEVVGGSRAEQVMQDTWGHLRADPAKTYTGTILFARSEYGGQGTIVIRTEGMPDGPWFYHGMLDWLDEQPAEEGSVYLWTGTYRCGPDDGHDFTGTSTEVLAEQSSEEGARTGTERAS